MTILQGKVAIITGAATGIGEATARLFAAQGAQVVVCDIDEDGGGLVAAAIGGRFVRTDVTREEDIEAAVAIAVKEYDRLDCMINNAGVVGPMESISTLNGAAWRKTVDILLNSVFYGIKHASRAMIGQGDGSILSTASVSGVSAMGPHPYVASKHAVIGLTKSAASELSASGIRVNAVAPGAVPTKLGAGMFGSMEAAQENARNRHPLQRLTEPDDIANGFLYLAADTGRNITGQVLTIDGGLTACPEAHRFRTKGVPQFVGALSRD